MKVKKGRDLSHLDPPGMHLYTRPKPTEFAPLLRNQASSKKSADPRSPREEAKSSISLSLLSRGRFGTTHQALPHKSVGIPDLLSNQSVIPPLNRTYQTKKVEVNTIYSHMIKINNRCTRLMNLVSASSLSYHSIHLNYNPLAWLRHCQTKPKNF